MEKKRKVVYDRETCIGAMACVAACPKSWEMGDDGKANLIGGKQNPKTGYFELDIDEKDLTSNQEAVEVCPVDCIKVKAKKEQQD